MKLCQVLALSALVLFTTIGAHADGVSTDDARIIIGGDPPPGTCMTKGLGTFMEIFTVNPKDHNGGGKFTGCLNSTAENFIGLMISGKTKVPKDTIGFGNGVCNGKPDTEKGDLFSSCTIVSQVGHSVTFDLTGGIILAGSSFFVDLNDDGSTEKGKWEGQLEITPLFAAAPEPGAMAMLLTGLGAIWFLRKRHTPKLNA